MTRLLLSALSASMHFSVAAASPQALPGGTAFTDRGLNWTADMVSSQDLVASIYGSNLSRTGPIGAVDHAVS